MHWSLLIPELTVSDFGESVRFYVDTLGFTVKYRREQPPFAFLEFEGAQVMLEQHHSSGWNVEGLIRPFGRGINLQIACEHVTALRDRVLSNEHRLYMDLEERWYEAGEQLVGQLAFLVQDPDGYLLRFIQRLGEKPARAQQ